MKGLFLLQERRGADIFKNNIERLRKVRGLNFNSRNRLSLTKSKFSTLDNKIIFLDTYYIDRKKGREIS